MTEPILTEGDRHSAVWQKMKKYLDAELAVLRKRNDKHLPDDGNMRLRERINAVKDLLALGEDKPVLPSGDENFKD